ncbi:protein DETOXIFICATION 24-like [Corylus avellana]|uniref:protein DETOXIFICATION 24-like n=1 Tax=Corylus avellana TaxID=13451 RepID=UPI00286C86C7|nr:protein DETOXIFICATION 24-like [Corylus avellana]
MDNGVEERLLGLEEQEESNIKQRIWVELKIMWRIAFPAILARISSFGMIVVTQSFIGHVSELDLAAYALVQSLILRFSNGILLGMSSATETLCGQAFGAGQYHMMGIYLQRSWIVDVTTATILVPLFVFTTPLFRLFGEEEDIAVESGPIALWMIAIIYSFVFALTIQMFLQAQLKNLIVGCLAASSFVIHILLSWIFVEILDLEVAGAMGAYCMSSWLMVLGEYVYVFGGWCPNTWKGFTKAAFYDILPVIKLSISSGVMLCLELWYNSVLVLFAGYLKNATVAITAFSICLNICAWEFMISLGFLGSACVRVSNELGKGNAKAAKFSIKVVLGISICIGVIFFVVCLAFGKQISYIFTSDEEIAEEVSSLSTLLAFSILLNSVQPVLLGVAIGAGFQGTVAWINIGSYYVFGVPLALLLGYVAGLQVKGLWIGLLAGVLMQTFVLSIVIWRLDWDDQVKKASERLNKWFLNTEETN